MSESTEEQALDQTKVKDAKAITEYQAKLNNGFQKMQQPTDIEEQWTLFKQAVTECIEETGRDNGLILNTGENMGTDWQMKGIGESVGTS